MNWAKDELASICDVFADGDWIETKDQSENGIRLIQTGNVGFGKFKLRDSKARYISEETFKRLRCTEIKQGDILISRLPDPVGRACVIPELNVKSITAVDCTIIRTNKKIINTRYLNYFCQSYEYFEQVKKNITGATRQRISRNLLGKIEVPVPPLPIQQKIVDKLDTIFAEIDKATAATEQKEIQLKLLEKSILKRAFKGELIK
jgi:type I restriction enzyme S subunit